MLRLRKSVEVAAILLVAGAFVVPNLFERPVVPMLLQTSEPGPIGVETVEGIIERGDVNAVYQVLSSYDRLDRFAKSDFWSAVAHLSLVELIPFAESRRALEAQPDTRRHIDQTLTILRMRQEEGR